MAKIEHLKMLGKKDEVVHLMNEWLEEELEGKFELNYYDQNRKEVIVN